jgi:hypothetical protein
MQWARISFGFALAHVLLSFALWSREYYPKFFGAGKMNWTGEFTLLFGAITTWLYSITVWSKPKNFYRISWIIAASLALHTAAMGFENWTTPGQWPGGMPPMSLLSFLMAVAGTITFAILGRRHAARAGEEP